MGSKPFPAMAALKSGAKMNAMALLNLYGWPPTVTRNPFSSEVARWEVARVFFQCFQLF